MAFKLLVNNYSFLLIEGVSNMRGLLILLSLSLFNISAYAGLGVDPVEYSCEESYYEYHYEYEKLRSIWKKFKDGGRKCNAKVIDWLTDSYTEDNLREKLPYSILDKEQVLEMLQNYGLAPRDLTLTELINYKDEIDFSKYKMPDLISRKEISQMAEDQKQIQRSFLANNPDGKWFTPILGKGAIEVSPYGYYRIDHILPPINKQQSLDLACSDLYRGFDSCEQDCTYLRTLLIELHSKVELFTKGWEWENEKMLCTTHERIREEIIPFESPYCIESCPDSSIPCNVCTVKNASSTNLDPIACLSEKDAKHTAKLNCYLNGGTNCDKVICNKVYNAGIKIPNSIGGRHETKYETSTKYFLEVESEVAGKANAIIKKATVGLKGEVELEFDIKTSVEIGSDEGSGTVYRYYTKRADGKMFECNEDMMTQNEPITCEDLDSLHEYPGFESSCSSKNEKFGLCQKYEVGDGRAFYNCSAEFENVRAVEGSAFLEFELDLFIGHTKIVGEAGVALAIAETRESYSKEFNAGGLTIENMKKTCDRWTQQWFETNFEDVVKKNNISAILHPKSLMRSNMHSLGQNEKISCSILDPKTGQYKKVEIAELGLGVGYENIEQEMPTGKNEKQIRRKRKVSLIDVRVRPTREHTLNPFSALLSSVKDLVYSSETYPTQDTPHQKGFSIPFESRHIDYIAQINAGDAKPSYILQILNSITPLSQGNSEIKNCEIVKKSDNFRKQEAQLLMLSRTIRLP